MKYLILVIVILCGLATNAQSDSKQTKDNTKMTKSLLEQLLAQNILSNSFALNQVSKDNVFKKLNSKTASVGFIYRHIGETIHLFGTFLGEQTTIQNTTMGQQDDGQGKDFEESKKLLSSGLSLLQNIVDKNTDEWWMEEIDTPFFGKVSRLRLFSHVLYHNSYHSGQISLTISRGTLMP